MIKNDNDRTETDSRGKVDVREQTISHEQRQTSESKSLLLNIHLQNRSSYLLAVVIHSNSSVVFIKEGLSLNRPIIVEYYRLAFFVLPPFF